MPREARRRDHQELGGGRRGVGKPVMRSCPQTYFQKGFPGCWSGSVTPLRIVQDFHERRSHRKLAARHRLGLLVSSCPALPAWAVSHLTPGKQSKEYP